MHNKKQHKEIYISYLCSEIIKCEWGGKKLLLIKKMLRDRLQLIRNKNENSLLKVLQRSVQVWEKMAAGDVVIRVVQPHEYEQVVQFIVDHFYHDEPLCSTEPKIVPGETDRTDILECLKGGTSILAVLLKENGEEELVGVNIGVPKDPDSVEKYFQSAEKEGNTKYGQILKLIGEANRQADLFKRYGVDKLFYSFMSCVKASCRGKNLGTRLKEELMALGKRLGYKLVSVDCSSFYSARLCKRMGWEVVNFISYKDYKDQNGQQIFHPPPPHEGLTTLAVRL